MGLAVQEPFVAYRAEGSGGIPRVRLVPRWMVDAHGRDWQECFPRAQRGDTPAGRDSQLWMLGKHGGDCGGGIPSVHFAPPWMGNAQCVDRYECFRKAQRRDTPAKRDSRRWMLDERGRGWYQCFP